MRRPDVIRFAAVALLRQRSRALVLILAVSLSVTSVLLLTALGEGARRYVADQFSSLGKDLLVMFPGRKETTGGLPPVTGNSLRQITLDDMHYLGQHQPNVRLVPLVMGFAEAKQGARLRQTMLLGSSNGLRDTHGLELLSGRWLPGDAAEDRSAVLLGPRWPVSCSVRAIRSASGCVLTIAAFGWWGSSPARAAIWGWIWPRRR